MQKFTYQKKLPVILEPEEAKKLLNTPNENSFIGLRNKVMISLMLNLGLRLSEVANLKPEDINVETGTLMVVQGKGGRDRILGIPDYLKPLLRKWNKKRLQNKYYFTTFKGKRVGARYIQDMVKRVVRNARITKNISPHSLRHTYATEYYRQTKDLETLRRILGHTDISTTTIYINLANIEVENGMRNFRGFA